MNLYHPYLLMRHEQIDGIGPWHWIASDEGSWYWPKHDWETTHRDVWYKHITNWNVVVQAGGCQGMYPRLFSNMFGRVYTFEPDPLNFMCLVNNCQKDNIIKMQAALGCESKLITINRISPTNAGTHQISEAHKLIPMLTIDMLNLDDCGFIQLDTEGYETNIIRGALKTIEKYKPVISCENSTGEIEELLKPFGYVPVDKTHMDTVYKIL